MKITIKFKGNEYDLTKYVAPDSMAMRMTIDNTFDTGVFIIPKIRGDVFTGLDMSRPLPRYADCEIERDGVYYNMLIADSVLTRTGEFYEHVVNLISRSKVLQMQTLPDITLTQHSQDTSLSSSMTNNATNTLSALEFSMPSEFFPPLFSTTPTQSGVKTLNADKALTFSASAVANDYIDGMTLKQAGKDYFITFSADVLNMFSTMKSTALFGVVTTAEAYDSSCVCIVDMYINGAKKSEIVRQNISGGIAETQGGLGDTHPTGQITPEKASIYKTLKHTPAAPSEVVSFRVRTEGKYKYRSYLGASSERDSEVFLQGITVYISVNHSDTFEHIRMDEWEQKKISLIEYPVKLNETSRSKLNSFVAPEMTFQGYDFWKASMYTGSVVGAIPKLRYDRTDNTDELSYDFYDDLENAIQDFPTPQIYRKKTSLDGYAAKAELNADNILKNNKGGVLPALNRYVGLRAIGRGQQQMTTENISAHTPYPIDKIYKVKVKGVPVLNSSGDTVYPASREWDITDRVVTKEHYDILPGQADYDPAARRSRQKNINNMLYYIQGERDLHGLSVTGAREATLLVEDVPNRALYEVIYCKAAEEAGESVTLKKLHDDGLTQDKLTQIYIEYEPYISTRARVYKEDQSGFEKPITLFFNENARVNDAFALGAYAQGEINRSSNTVLEVKGYCSLAQVPSLGSKNSDGYVLTEVQLQFYANDIRVAYYGKYSKDYTVLSEFTGIKSEHRIWEVPKTNIVLSNRKEENKIYVSDEPLAAVSNQLYAHLLPRANILGNAPTCARFMSEISGNTHVLSVDSAAYGNCISWTVRAHDNYSTGSQRHEIEVDGKPVLYQIDTRYTDDFGRMSRFNLAFYRELNGVTDSELLNTYPEITSTITAPVIYGTFGDYPKDAREIFSYSVNHIFLSHKVDKIFIYNGFTKYHNRIRVQNETGQIKCAVADYAPSKAAALVDRGRIRTQGINVQTHPLTSALDISTTESAGQGYIFYHDQTGELLLFFKAPTKTARLYFGELA